MAKRKRKKAKRRGKKKKRATKRRVTRRRAPKRRKKKRKGRRRKPSAAFMKPMKLSPALADVLGGKALPRTQVTKKLWTYIKRHKLQDKKNRRMINADAKLKKVFGGRGKVNMFQMTKLVSRHLK
jgi:chromatin remodeling complex protein RSC6